MNFIRLEKFYIFLFSIIPLSIIIGPTKLSHLDCIERMLDKDYWARIIHLHNIVNDLNK